MANGPIGAAAVLPKGGKVVMGVVGLQGLYWRPH